MKNKVNKMKNKISDEESRGAVIIGLLMLLAMVFYFVGKLAMTIYFTEASR